MGRRISFILRIIAGIWLMILPGEHIAFAQISGTDIDETEIRRKWDEFNNAKSHFRVTGSYPYMACFEAAALKHDVPLPLLVAVARGESNFDPEARSDKDCMGIMQIRWPGTAKDLGIVRKADLFEPCINIDAGARYLSKLLTRYGGDSYLAVAAYNYGPNAINFKRVPDGARWYAAYIHNHLQHVLSTPYQEIGRALIMRFTFYQKAAEFAAYLQERVKNLPVEVFRSQEYTFDVYLTYKNKEENNKFLRCLMETTGIKPIDGGQL